MNKKTIITVNNCPNARYLVKKTLSDAGFCVLSAGDGKEALEHLKVITVDLIITDMELPVMNGLVLVESLRKTNQYRSIPVLVLTDETEPEIKQQVKQAGASGWLSKPFNNDKLLAVVNKLLIR